MKHIESREKLRGRKTFEIAVTYFLFAKKHLRRYVPTFMREKHYYPSAHKAGVLKEEKIRNSTKM